MVAKVGIARNADRLALATAALLLLRAPLWLSSPFLATCRWRGQAFHSAPRGPLHPALVQLHASSALESDRVRELHNYREKQQFRSSRQIHASPCPVRHAEATE